MKPVWESIFLIVCVFGENLQHPPGHLLPFGGHTVPHEVETLDEFPAPREFFERYQLPGRPVLFKSILERVRFPAYGLWTDDYLRKQYGDEYVEVEVGKKEDRSGEGRHQKLKKFLDEYKQKDVYMVQDLKKSMFADMYIPRSLQCGGYEKYIETVVIWFSSGGTKSVIHTDTQENFNCLLDGTKDLILIDRKYTDQIEADGFKQAGHYSSIDVESVDMYKYPRIREVPTFKTTLEPGDCVFIPYKWYHQVNSFGKRNLAVNVWFDRIPWFNFSDCENVETDGQTVRLADYGYIKQFEKANVYLLEGLVDTVNVTREAFLEYLVKPEAEDKDAILAYVDKNGDSSLTWDELLHIDAKEFVERFQSSLKVQINFEDMAEYYHDDDTVPEQDETSPHDEF